MAFLLSLFLGFSLAEAEVLWVYLPKATPIYAQGRPGARLLFMAGEGERVGVRQKGPLYSRVQFRQGPKWKLGYALNSDLQIRGTGSRGDFGFGGGAMYTYLRYAGKAFETEDQVQYQTKEFVSTSYSPFVVAQYKKEDFWRLILAYRQTDYSTSAVTDVPGARAHDMELEHTMYSGTIQKMWTPLAKPTVYFGLGVEASRAAEANLEMDGNKLAVPSEDLPTYFGGHLAAGGQMDIWSGFSAFSELRIIAYVNQSPMVFGAEVACGLLYWP